jgi:hypothetical protein
MMVFVGMLIGNDCRFEVRCGVDHGLVKISLRRLSGDVGNL